MQVRDVMTPNPLTARPWTPIAEVAELLMREDIRHLPVIDAGALVGMVSDRDVQRFARDALFQDTPAARRHLQAPVSTIMATDVVDTIVDNDVDDAIEKLVENKVGALPVVDGEGVLVGIVSTLDVLKHAMGRL